MTETRTRLDEKHAELETYNVTREEYDTTVEEINKIIQTIENKSKQTRENHLQQNLNLFKVNSKHKIPLIFHDYFRISRTKCKFIVR